jgi:hypothetical protein
MRKGKKQAYTIFYRNTNPPLDREPMLDTLYMTHTLLCQIRAYGLDDVYTQMQGEAWSPNGEARPLLESLNLFHTSMSVGDVVLDSQGRYFACAEYGWDELNWEKENGQA